MKVKHQKNWRSDTLQYTQSNKWCKLNNAAQATVSALASNIPEGFGLLETGKIEYIGYFVREQEVMRNNTSGEKK